MKSKYDVGTIHEVKSGKFIEVLLKSGTHVKVKFIDSGEIKDTTINSILRKNVQPLNEKIRKFKTGEIFENNNGSKYEVIEVLKNPYLKIKFLDKSGYERIVQPSHIKTGVVNNPYEKSKFGVGYIGDCNKKDLSYKKAKNIWDKVLQRCYDKTYLKNNKAYRNVTVCEEWLNFSIFFEWFKLNYIKNFFIDKDLFQLGVSDKIYSPNTCIFLDRKINNFIKIPNKKDKWLSMCTDFNSGSSVYLGTFKTKEEARQPYVEFKSKQIDSAKVYMKNLGYYSDDIISKLDKLKELI